ncbi:MAG TPA: hypothetical protein VGJ04_05975 [Pirellulales bacterium]|jgi:hypothetical protein
MPKKIAKGWQCPPEETPSLPERLGWLANEFDVCDLFLQQQLGVPRQEQ